MVAVWVRLPNGEQKQTLKNMKPLKINKNWIKQAKPTAYFEKLIEPNPMPGQSKTNPLKPQGK
jgi:hypothetical protein